MPGLQLDLLSLRMLLTDWFTRLAREANLDFTQRSGDKDTFVLSHQNGLQVTARFIDDPPNLEFVCSDATKQSVVANIVAEGVRRVGSGDFGGVVWYSGELSETGVTFSSFSLVGPLFQR